MNINKKIGLVFLFLILVAIAIAHNGRYELNIPQLPFWDNSLSMESYRIGWKFYNNASSNYTDTAMSVSYNFTKLLKDSGINATNLDVNSVRVTQHYPIGGGVVNSNVSYQVICS